MGKARAVQMLVGRYLPNVVKGPAKEVRRRLRQRRADRSFGYRTLPDADRDRDAPAHVVVIVVDALRYDAIDEQTTRFLDSLSGTDAVAPATWTYPSICSLMTGQYPHEHGAMRQSDEGASATEDEMTLPPRLDDDIRTVPELFAAAGYDTYGGFGFEMPMQALSGRFQNHALHTRGAASAVADRYLDWFASRECNTTFAYLHLFDLHGPFDTTPPREYQRAHEVDDDVVGTDTWKLVDTREGVDAERYQTHRWRLYEAAVDYVDDEVAALADRLPEDAAMLVTSDHGEAFWEYPAFDERWFFDSRPAYCVGHGGTPYESIARVPLLGDSVPIRQGPASGVDVAPTLLDLVGIDLPEDVSGHSHVGGPLPECRTTLIEAARYGHEKKAAYVDDWKLLVSRGDDQCFGFKLPAEEPTELPPTIKNKLRESMPPWPDQEDERTVDQSVQRRLSDLGYT